MKIDIVDIIKAIDKEVDLIKFLNNEDALGGALLIRRVLIELNEKLEKESINI